MQLWHCTRQDTLTEVSPPGSSITNCLWHVTRGMWKVGYMEQGRNIETCGVLMHE